MENADARLGFWAAAAAFVAAVGYLVVQILQVAGALTEPLASILIYAFSFCIAPPFLVAMAALHALTPPGRRLGAQIGLMFATMYATYVVLVYAVQLVTVVPAGVAAERVLVMRPQSMFWVLDGLGYVSMGAATLFAAYALPIEGLGRWARRLMLANGAVTPLITFAYLYPHFSTWVLFVGSPWAVTAPGSLLALAIWFRGYDRSPPR